MADQWLILMMMIDDNIYLSTYGVFKTSRSHWPLMSSSSGCSVMYRPSNSSFLASSFSLLKITSGICQKTIYMPFKWDVQVFGNIWYQLQHFRNTLFFRKKVYISESRVSNSTHLETVVTDNTDEWDDSVQGGNEGQCRLHVASALL